MTPAARILVVDDEALAREALCELLAREHYQVESTGEGRAVE
jgi:CheY-like chemotaxis protein